MTELLHAEEARHLTRKTTADEHELGPLIVVTDMAIKFAISKGDWTIRPIAVVEAVMRYVVTTRVAAALRRHYEERGFQWKVPFACGASAIEVQRAVELSWAEEETS